MFCPNCGAQLPDDAKFCGQCGANVPDAVQPPESPAETAPVQPAPAEPVAAEPVTEPQPSASIPGPVPEEPILTGRKHSAGIVIGLIAAAVAVIAALVIFVVPMVMQSLSPKAYLSACAANTMSAYAKELDAMHDRGETLEVLADKDMYDPEIVFMADNVSSYVKDAVFEMHLDDGSTCFVSYDTADFNSVTRWIMYNDDLKVAAFALPATCRPEGAHAAREAGTLIYLKPGQSRSFKVRTGLR